MKINETLSRREFAKRSAMGLLSTLPVLSLPGSFQADDFVADSNLKMYVFSKHLQFLNYRDMCEAVKEIGFDGIDLTVRPGGHVSPDKVADELPEATEVMRSFGISSEMITTKVMDPKNPIDINVLKTASQEGVLLYRMGWYKYTDQYSLEESTKIFRKSMKALARLNKKLGLRGMYQNHSGNFMGAAIWDLHYILRGIAKEEIGCQYDLMHATVEGGLDWEIGLRLIEDRIHSLAIKDFKWAKVNGKWKPIKTPLGEGMVNFERCFSILKKSNINVPVTMHFEYDLGGAEHGNRKLSVDQKEVFNKMKKDLVFLRDMWEKVN